MTKQEAEEALLELATRRARRWKATKSGVYATLTVLSPGIAVGAGGWALITYGPLTLLVIPGLIILGLLAKWWVAAYEFFQNDKWK